MQTQMFKRENFLAIKSIKNKCKSLCNKQKHNISKKISNNKQFWNLVKPFLTNKSSFSSESIIIKNKEKFINDEKELGEIFNNYYTNIVEKASGNPIESSFENCDDNFKI